MSTILNYIGAKKPIQVPPTVKKVLLLTFKELLTPVDFYIQLSSSLQLWNARNGGLLVHVVFSALLQKQEFWILKPNCSHQVISQKTGKEAAV